ncbi:MAG TPA: hypothetical protein VGP04_07365, partial [Pseudonocardiaceae bacterium]|nr:hypothetical protein [Pseudonocardiaceae bacterium]
AVNKLATYPGLTAGLTAVARLQRDLATSPSFNAAATLHATAFANYASSVTAPHGVVPRLDAYVAQAVVRPLAAEAEAALTLTDPAAPLRKTSIDPDEAWRTAVDNPDILQEVDEDLTEAWTEVLQEAGDNPTDDRSAFLVLGELLRIAHREIANADPVKRRVVVASVVVVVTTQLWIWSLIYPTAWLLIGSAGGFGTAGYKAFRWLDGKTSDAGDGSDSL